MNNTFLKYLDAERDRLINSKKENLEKVNKIELGLVDDFEKQYEAIIDRDIKVSNKLIDDLRKAEVATKEIKNDYEKVLKVGNKIEESAKEIGVELPQTLLNKIRSTEVMIKNKTTVINEIKSMYNIEF